MFKVSHESHRKDRVLLKLRPDVNTNSLKKERQQSIRSIGTYKLTLILFELIAKKNCFSFVYAVRFKTYVAKTVKIVSFSHSFLIGILT